MMKENSFITWAPLFDVERHVRARDRDMGMRAAAEIRPRNTFLHLEMIRINWICTVENDLRLALRREER